MKHTLMILLASATLACGQDYTFTHFAGVVDGRGSANGPVGVGRFNQPTGVTLDAAGNFYVADYGSHTIRKITPDGDVTTIAGLAGNLGSADGINSEARFNEPVSVAVDSAGNVYVADRINNTIRKITPVGTDWETTTLAGIALTPGSDDGHGDEALFTYPNGVAVDSADNVYVADKNNHTIRKITPSADVTTIAGQAGSSGNTDGVNSDARFNGPTGVAVDTAGNLYVADFNNSRIRKVTPVGADWEVTTLAVGFNNPFSVTVDNAGNVYVADTYHHTIQMIAPDLVVTIVAGETGTIGSSDGTGIEAHFEHPFGITVDSARNLYVADTYNERITKGTPPLVLLITITSIQSVSGNVQIDFTADPADTANLFTLTSSSAVNGTYNDVVPPAAISQVGPPGSFRAVTGLNGNSQFYRVKK